jgi:Ca2+-binding EF-hand superfamily protein
MYTPSDFAPVAACRLIVAARGPGVGAFVDCRVKPAGGVNMHKLLASVAAVAILLATSVAARAQDGTPKKPDPDQLKKLQDKINGQFDLEMLKKLAEQIGGQGGQFDPEMIKKLIQQFGGIQGGKLDPEQLKKLMDKIGGAGGGQFDPEKLKKLLDKIGNGGQLDPEQLKKLMDQLGKPGKVAPGGGNRFLPVKDVEGTFKKLDTDGDGKLTKKEFAKIADELKDTIGQDQVEPVRAYAEKLYDQLDPEGVGISLEQFRRAVGGQTTKKKKTDK